MLEQKPLTKEQLETYARDGVLCLRGLIPEQLLLGVEGVLGGWTNKRINAWFRRGLLKDKFENCSFTERIVKAWNAAGRPQYDPSPTDEIVSREMFDLMTYPPLVNVARLLAGSNQLAIHGRFHCRPKLPDQKFTDTPWHQDAQCQPLSANTGVVIVWVPLVDVSERNACLAFARGRDKEGVYPVYKDPTGYYVSMHPADSDKFEVTTFPMNRGDVLCFNEMVPHRSMLNQTSQARWSVDFRYEKLGNPGSIGLQKGFICSHDDPSLVEHSYQHWISEKWPEKKS